MTVYQKYIIKRAIAGLLHSGHFNRAYNLEQVLKELGETYG